MLASYTWSDFFIFLSGGLFLYYLFVIFFYYSEDLNKLIAGKKQTANAMSTVASSYNYKPPIVAETLHVNAYDSNEEELHTEEKNHTKNIDTYIEDTSDWNNTTAFTMDYKDATVSEEALLVNVDVAEAGSEEEEVEEGGIPADDYIEATVEIQKETIAAEKKELTKEVLRKAYFNNSYIALQNTNENAKANTGTLLQELQEEGKIPATEIAVYNDFVTAAAGDEDIQALLHTLNN